MNGLSPPRAWALLAWRWRMLLRRFRGLGHSFALRGFRGTLRHARNVVADSEPVMGPPRTPAIPKQGPCILVVDALIPDATRDSGSVRMLEILVLLREIGWNVTLAPDSGRATLPEREVLERSGIDLIGVPGALSIPQWLRTHGNRLEAAMLCRHSVAAMHFDLIRSFAPQARIAFDTVDLHSLRERRTAEVTGDKSLERAARRSWRSERRLARASDVTFVVSPVEQELLRNEIPNARVELLSNIHEVRGNSTPFSQRNGILFVGGFAHPPNRDAAYWLVEEILPELHRDMPGMPLHLVGAIPDQDREYLRREYVHVHGQVTDLQPLMELCLVAAAPLRSGAGVKGKVNSAMSHGLPVVATSVAAEGMHLHHGNDVLIADTAVQFASAIALLCRDRELWGLLSNNGMRNIELHFSRERARKTLESAFDPAPALT